MSLCSSMKLEMNSQSVVSYLSTKQNFVKARLKQSPAIAESSAFLLVTPTAMNSLGAARYLSSLTHREQRYGGK